MSKRSASRRRQSLRIEHLENRRVLAASLGWDGPGLGSAELTYYIANTPSSLSREETEAAIQTALDAWSSVVDINFTEVNTPGLQDSLDFSFTRIDGTAGTLAQAYFPDDVNRSRIAGDIQFDSAESWEVGNSKGNAAFDLVWVAVHEIGHALGLEHDSDTDAILAPSVSPSQVFSELSTSDIEAIQQLYAPSDESTDDTVSDGTTTDDTTTDGNTDDTTNGVGDTNPFPSDRWRRGGNWYRFGGRIDVFLVTHNYVNPTDVKSDSQTSPLDVLVIVNGLNMQSGTTRLTDIAGLWDTNGDSSLNSLDILTVINSLNRRSADSRGSTDATLSSADGTSPECDFEIDDDGLVDDSPSDDTSDDTSSVDTSTVDARLDDKSTDETTTEETSKNQTDTDGSLELPDCGPTANSGNRLLLTLSSTDFMSQFDTSGDGLLSEDEVSARVWEILASAGSDADSDGLISSDELATVATATRQTKYDSQDEDSDGLLTVDEVGERFWSRVSTADTDADDAVSFTEFETWLTSGDGGLSDIPHRGHPRGGFANVSNGSLLHLNTEDFIGEFDTDADGAVSESELSNKLWSQLTKAGVDADDNGLLTADELTTAIGAVRQEKFDSFDVDLDGLLTEEEAGSRKWQQLADADTDADDAVSFTEFDTWLNENSDQLLTPPSPPRHHGMHHFAVNPRAADAVFGMLGRGMRR